MLALKLALLTLLDTDHDYHPPTTPLDQLSNINFGIGCFLIVAFTIFYGLRFRWWKIEGTPVHPRGRVNWAGISIFSIFVALSATLAYIVVTRLLTPGDYQFRDVFRLAVSFLLPAVGTLMFVALFLSRDQLLRELSAEAKAKDDQRDPTV